MYVFYVLTNVTLHETTPMKFAVTPFFNFSFKCVVPTATAHKLTAVHSGRWLLALSSFRTKWPCDLIWIAVIWGVFQVYKVFFCWFVVFGVFGLKLCSSFVKNHFRGTIVFILQSITDSPEIRQLSPARFKAARPWHTVAFTRYLRVSVNCLKKETKTIRFNTICWNKHYSYQFIWALSSFKCQGILSISKKLMCTDKEHAWHT